ncbi:MAG: hypothetical protein R2729_16710 [Bryobacteraceae bacterium]
MTNASEPINTIRFFQLDAEPDEIFDEPEGSDGGPIFLPPSAVTAQEARMR